jgi:hypothetical protein
VNHPDDEPVSDAPLQLLFLAAHPPCPVACCSGLSQSARPHTNLIFPELDSPSPVQTSDYLGFCLSQVWERQTMRHPLLLFFAVALMLTAARADDWSKTYTVGVPSVARGHLRRGYSPRHLGPEQD